MPRKVVERSRYDFVVYYRELYKSYPPEEFGFTEYLEQWLRSEFNLFSKYQMIIAKVNDQIVGYFLLRLINHTPIFSNFGQLRIVHFIKGK